MAWNLNPSRGDYQPEESKNPLKENILKLPIK